VTDQDEPHFAQCMVAETRPMYWSADPVATSNNFYQMMVALTDPSKDGFAYVRQMRPRGDVRAQGEWWSGKEAHSWLDSLWTNVWSPLAHKCEAVHDNAYQPIFDELTDYENVVRIFFDSRRLSACIGESDDDEPEQKPSYLVITADWSFDEYGILWSPQMLAMTYWPVSRDLAPTNESDEPQSPLDASSAAYQLEYILYRRNMRQLRLLRSAFDISQANISTPGDQFSNIQLRPPVFYGVFPVSTPGSPQELLREPWRTATRVVAKQALGTERIETRAIASAIIDSEFLSYRREVIGKADAYTYYLLVRGHSNSDLGGGEENFAYISDQLGYSSVLLSQRTSTFNWDIAEKVPSLIMWNSGLEQATRLTHQLQELTALDPLSSHRRRKVAFLLQRIYISFSGTRSRVAGALAEIERLNSEWHVGIDGGSNYIRDRISLQPLVDGSQSSSNRPLADLLTPGPVSESASEVRFVSEYSNRLKQQMDETGALWESIVEYEREEDRARQERQNQIIGIGLAAIAILTAVPILIGSPSWSELENSAEGWSGPARLLGLLLLRTHDGVLISAIGATVIAIAFLLFVLGRSVIGPFTRRPGLVPLGGELRRISESNSEAERLARRLGQGVEDAKTREEILSALEELDSGLCTHILRLWKEFRRLRGETTDSDILERLSNEVKALLLRQELFDARPIPLWTPLALCLYRYRSEDMVGLSLVPNPEFFRVMSIYGYGLDDRERVDNMASGATHLEMDKFLEYLNGKGVNVRKRGWEVESATEADEASKGPSEFQPASSSYDQR
jgi:hypothetical protein